MDVKESNLLPLQESTQSSCSAAVDVLVADDDPVVRLGVTQLLASQMKFNVVGEAASYVEALRKIDELQPDVVLLDPEMKDARGVAGLRRLLESYPDVRVIVFTARRDDDHVFDVIKIGVDAYALKDSSQEFLFEAIRTVAKGNTYMDPQLASNMMEQLREYQVSSSLNNTPLTERESTVLDSLALGKSNRDIAKDLTISENTVKHHISAILKKLGARNRTEAIKIAAHEGLVSLGSSTP